MSSIRPARCCAYVGLEEMRQYQAQVKAATEDEAKELVAPVIELSGSLAGAGTNGLTVTAGDSTIRGLAINRFKGRGISVEARGGNTVAGNFVGTDTTGMLDRGNESAGIFVNSGGNTIGGPAAADRNLISGNDRQGIYLIGGAAQNNRVLGNWIGTDALGTGAVPNNQYGVWVASANNRVGGPAAGEGNVISGNRWGGVYVVGATAGGNLIQGNRIGTNEGGTAKLANDGSGVMIALAPNNTVGGSVAGAANVLSGNAQQGVYVLGATATGNVIAGNRIGTNAAGTAAVGNSQNGVYLRGPSNRVGGTATGILAIISRRTESTDDLAVICMIRLKK